MALTPVTYTHHIIVLKMSFENNLTNLYKLIGMQNLDFDESVVTTTFIIFIFNYQQLSSKIDLIMFVMQIYKNKYT